MPGSEYEQFRTGALGIPPYRKSSIQPQNRQGHVIPQAAFHTRDQYYFVKQQTNTHWIQTNAHCAIYFYLPARVNMLHTAGMRNNTICSALCSHKIAGDLTRRRCQLAFGHYKGILTAHRWSSALTRFMASTITGNLNGAVSHLQYREHSFRTFRNVMLRMFRPTLVRN